MTREEEIKARLGKATPPPFVITETGIVRCPLCDGDGEVDSILLDQPRYPVSVQVYGIGTNFKDHEAFLHHSLDDIRYLLARNEKMQAVVDAAKELVTVATLRGDNDLPHPCNDPILWTARMQDAWNWTSDALTDLDAKESDNETDNS